MQVGLLWQEIPKRAQKQTCQSYLSKYLSNIYKLSVTHRTQQKTLYRILTMWQISWLFFSQCPGFSGFIHTEPIKTKKIRPSDFSCCRNGYLKHKGGARVCEGVRGTHTFRLTSCRSLPEYVKQATSNFFHNSPPLSLSFSLTVSLFIVFINVKAFAVVLFWFLWR